MDDLKEVKVFTDVNIKSMSAEEVSRIIDSRLVKARFVARGLGQIYSDSTATPHMSSLKLLLTIPAQKQWGITVTDIQDAFLHALVGVSEVIHVKPPTQV
eukprot:760198-Amphidinium_carterae.1